MRGISLFASVAFVSVANALSQPTNVGIAEEDFSMMSRPVRIRQGQVHNAVQEPILLPKWVRERFSDPDKQMAITGFDLEVYDEAGQKSPLWASYFHHYLLYLGSENTLQKLWESSKKRDPLSPIPDSCPQDQKPLGEMNERCFLGMQTPRKCLELFSTTPASSSKLRGSSAANDEDFLAFGGAAGSEFRNNLHAYPYPYALLLNNPEAIAPLVHLLNTKSTTKHDNKSLSNAVSPLYECPCTKQREFDLEKNTIDGCIPAPPFWCNKDMASSPGCSISNYPGGYRCCEHGVFLMDTDGVDTESLPISTFYVKFHFKFRTIDLQAQRRGEVGPHTETKKLYGSSCCDATGDKDHFGIANIEYTVPKCPEGTAPEDCVHETVSVQHAAMGSADEEVVEIELVYANAHLHKGAISLQLFNHETGELLCEARPLYGATEAAGDEEDYLVGLEPCKWETPIKMRSDTLLRTVALYDAREQLTGVMALWLMSHHVVGPVDGSSTASIM